MLYRGCADPSNLPWEVDTSLNCQYQGQIPSLWYFCDGHLCNGGRFGTAGICSSDRDISDRIDGDAYVEIVHGDSDVMGYNQDYPEPARYNGEPWIYPSDELGGGYPEANGVEFEHYHDLYLQQAGNSGYDPDRGSYQTGDMGEIYRYKDSPPRYPEPKHYDTKTQPIEPMSKKTHEPRESDQPKKTHNAEPAPSYPEPKGKYEPPSKS